MKCPIDNIDLVLADRQGVEIDYCPQCRGVWLDRGELDKILERSQKFMKDSYAPQSPAYQPQPYRQNKHGDGEHGSSNNYPIDPNTGQPYKKKKESWLSDILDFG